ncbi:hypothetical protein BST95_02880 [Halioglobus japonicus]|uniref:HTH araC/xylS-type domain-containing protein n=1 Tax=Halioglobus japonicus TaxID=930805 RepID=A0AAP8MCW8_9GAMM|nr:nuclear transport factor 2 family protein [Halioglobus japonicus]AQA17327.1 hypothetical protein BST95_02880 [Halioglobus japonicus]PLW85249.1 hypothetical protein C0029_11450 [Halioglobus japonicus]GHD24157.1 hypothetical protein GCM10007052_37570 [Halioglobus japonicus]
MATENELRSIVHRYFDCWNRHAATDAAEFFCEDGILYDGYLKESFRGAVIKEYIESTLDEVPNLKFEIVDELYSPAENRCVLQVLSTWINAGDSATCAVESAEFFEIENGRIKSEKSFYQWRSADSLTDQDRALITRYIQSWNDYDAAEVSDCFTENGIYEDAVTKQRYFGKELPVYIQSCLREGTDLRYELLDDASRISDRRVLIQTLTSGFDKPDGRYFEQESIEILDIEDGRILSTKVFYEDIVLDAYTADQVDLAASYIQCWSQRDTSALLAKLTDNAVFEDAVSGEKMGFDALAGYCDKVYARVPDLVVEHVSDISLTAADSIVFRVVSRGHCGIERPFSVDCMIVLKITGEKINAVQVFYENVDEQEVREKQAPAVRVGVDVSSAMRRKYQRSGLSDADKNLYKVRLSSVMHDQKIFKDNDLSLPKLASFIGISSNHLSQLINSEFGVNFFDFVNRMRIEESKVLLRDEQCKDTILKIAIEVGFNSTSTFYSAFKKFTGESPIKYRKHASQGLKAVLPIDRQKPIRESGTR